MANEGIVKRCSCMGYSLAELVIVIACASILFTAGVPGIVRLQQEWALWASARSLEASLQWGRMHAISANTPMLFEVEGSRQKFYWIDPGSGDAYLDSIRHFSGTIRIASCPRRPLQFYQHGNAVPAGTYVIAGGIGSYSVVVSPGGRIRIQRN
jgi:type II secretory pathway pseudopilin PulG